MGIQGRKSRENGVQGRKRRGGGRRRGGWEEKEEAELYLTRLDHVTHSISDARLGYQRVRLMRVNKLQ